MLTNFNFDTQVYAASCDKRNGVTTWKSKKTNIIDELLNYSYWNTKETLITCLSPYGVRLNGTLPPTPKNIWVST